MTFDRYPLPEPNPETTGDVWTAPLFGADDPETINHDPAIDEFPAHGAAQIDNPVFQPGNIPAELKALTQWCVWRRIERDGGKLAKMPYQPNGQPAKSNDAATWSTFEAALAAYRTEKYDGIGIFVADDLTGIDLDHCIDASGATPAATEILEKFSGSYCEVSPSGTGYRIFCYGKPGRSGKNGGAVKWVEVYATGSPRYLTVTGNVISNAAVTGQQPALDWLHATYFSKPATSKPDTTTRVNPSLDDAALLDKASKASNGALFDSLWRGDTSGHGGNASDADMALCGLLAFWTGGDASAIDRLFRQSGLMREKWDTRRGETTYGAATIATAIANCKDFYSGRKPAGNGEHGRGADTFHGREPGADDEPIPGNRERRESREDSLFIPVSRFIGTPGAPAWTIRKWLPEASIIQLFGDPSSGKSFLSIDWACCVASGKEWNGNRVKQGAVLYIAGEGHHGLKRRFAAWQEVHGTIPDSLFVSQRAVILNATGADAVFKAVKELPEIPGLIVVDTMATVLHGDENKGEDVGGFINILKTLIAETGACCLIVHHSGHGDKSRGRGWSGLPGAIDGGFKMTKDESLCGELTVTKDPKDGARPAALSFELEVINLPESWNDPEEPDEPVTSCVFRVTGKAETTTTTKAKKLTANQSIAVKALEKALVDHGGTFNGQFGTRIDDWRLAAYKAGIGDTPESKKKNFQNVRSSLLRDNHVVCADDIYWLSDIGWQSAAQALNTEKRKQKDSKE